MKIKDQEMLNYILFSLAECQDIVLETMKPNWRGKLRKMMGNLQLRTKILVGLVDDNLKAESLDKFVDVSDFLGNVIDLSTQAIVLNETEEFLNKIK